MGVFSDITEGRQGEELYRTLADSLPTGVNIIQDGKFVFVNRQFVADTGYSEEELLGMDPLDIVHPEDRETVRANAAAMACGKRLAPYEFRAFAKDGRMEWVMETVTSIQYRGRRASLGNFTPITERKEMEETLLRSHEELRNLAAHARSAIEEERRSIARDIHDELGQSLVALKMDLARLTAELPAARRRLVARTEAMTRLADEAIKTVKETATKLRPGVLDDLGIAAALEWQAGEFHRRTGIRCHVSMEPGDIAVDRDVATAVFRIFQEALTNVLRHASATKVSASLKREDGSLVLRVRDNGIGITPEQAASSASLGLIGMRERAYFIGGELDIRRSRNEGTEIRLTVPPHVGVGSVD